MVEELILGGGAIWTLEALLGMTKGIVSVNNGYYKIGEYKSLAFNPDDKLEVVSIKYDSEQISLENILDIFYFSHDPSFVSWEKDECFYPANRSAIIYFNNAHEPIIKGKINECTKLLYGDKFIFVKEDKYDNFFINNPEDQFSQSIILPKVEKFKNYFKEFVK